MTDRGKVWVGIAGFLLLFWGLVAYGLVRAFAA